MSEAWFNNDEKTLVVLTSGDRCFVMLSDSEESIYPAKEDKSDDRLVSFILDNGQEDWFPLSETIEASVAIKVIDYFMEKGQPAPFVKWV